MKKGSIFFFYLIVVSQTLCSQRDTTIRFEQKFYKVFTSLKDARLANPDSVFGLTLCCENLRKFPLEIMKYKNLEFLDFEPDSWHSNIVYNQLPEKLKRKYNKEKNKHLEPTIFIYRPNHIKSIPDTIKYLKKLKVLCIANIGFDYDKLEYLQSILPNVIFDPEWLYIKDLRDNGRFLDMEPLEVKKYKKLLKK